MGYVELWRAFWQTINEQVLLSSSLCELQAVLEAAGQLDALGSLEDNDPDAADEAEGEEDEDAPDDGGAAAAAGQEENDLAADLAKAAVIQ